MTETTPPGVGAEGDEPPQGDTAPPDDGPGVFQIVMHEVMREQFETWLQRRGLCLFQMPIEDDLPTYGIGFAIDHPQEVRDQPKDVAAAPCPLGLRPHRAHTWSHGGPPNDCPGVTYGPEGT